VDVDAVIFGGGVAGLWMLSVLRDAGYDALLLDPNDLGTGQTVCSQGILHGGLKYTLSGLMSGSAKAIREMPALWRDCLGGRRSPNLTRTRIQAEFCYLWQSQSISGALGMIGARSGLRVRPHVLDPDERPPVLRHMPGVVARLDEQVIDPCSLLWDLAEPLAGQILRIDRETGLELEFDEPGRVRRIRLIDPEEGDAADVHPQAVILAAGEGNAELVERLGLASTSSPIAMQRRPLHMVMVRSPRLPLINGHCVDGRRTRATITAARSYDDEPVWQVGGQIAEDGVAMRPDHLIQHARSELAHVLPALDLAGARWCTYRVDRTEPAMRGGKRPESAFLTVRGSTLIAWPTKLVLAPRLAELAQGELAKLIGRPSGDARPDSAAILKGWAQPGVAVPPWESPSCRWTVVD
jgi:glycine/D-amino acid oxidase-like deaminating enzyme